MMLSSVSLVEDHPASSKAHNVRRSTSSAHLPRFSKIEILFTVLSILMTTYTTITVALIPESQQFREHRSSGLSIPVRTAIKEAADDTGSSVKYSAEALVEIAASENTNAAAGVTVDTGFLDAFTASFSVIMVTELGDKTFFIAAIMAMRHPRLIIFTGAISALALMTVLSVIFGMATTIVPKIYTYYVSTALFAIFGVKMIYEGYYMRDSNAQEELEEVQSDLRKREDDLARDVNVSLVENLESGVSKRNAKKRPTYLTTRVIMQAFTMTFLAEWGDRSQLTTIILAASKNIYGVVSGGVVGHFICTGIAVIGGRMVATKISVRTVTLIGGLVFLSFALYALMMRPNDL